jgi:hypothetical protein
MNRRSFLTGLIAAPVVIRTEGLLMPIKAQPLIWDRSSAIVLTNGNLIQPQQLVGDVIYNRSPDINDCLGWLCTEQGSPGTWAELRLVGATLGVVAGRSQPPPYGCIFRDYRRDASYRRVKGDWPFVLDIPNRRGVAQFG